MITTDRPCMLFLLLVTLLSPFMTGCTGEKAGVSMNEELFTALTWRDEALEYDKAGQMRLAELYYKKAYELMKDNPSRDWLVYGDAGYRYACMLYQRGDIEDALAVVNEMLDKAEEQKDYPATNRAGLLSLMAQCQLHLAMPEAAKQTFAKVYQNQLTVLGGEKRGDFNLAIACSNIFFSYFETGEYEEAGQWLSRYENELLACEQLGIGDSNLIEEQKGSLALYKAQYLQATGRTREAATIYAAIPPSRISMAANILDATGYLMAAGRYDEAAYWYERFDSSFLATVGTKLTFDNIATNLSPRYQAYRKAGRNAEALFMADSISTAIDSALVWQKKSDAAELAVIYQTHERDLQIKDLRFTVSLHRIVAVGLAIILLLIAYLLYRARIYNNVLAEKNRSLYEQIKEREREGQDKLVCLQVQPEESLTIGQKLYRRLCTLMAEQQPYTDENLNRHTLASMLGTNHRYIDEAIRECSDSQSTKAFIDSYRVNHAARLLTTTDDSIALIGAMSGYANRTTFNEQFRNHFKMTPSEYRKAAKAEVKLT